MGAIIKYKLEYNEPHGCSYPQSVGYHLRRCLEHNLLFLHNLKSIKILSNRAFNKLYERNFAAAALPPINQNHNYGVEYLYAASVDSSNAIINSIFLGKTTPNAFDFFCN